MKKDLNRHGGPMDRGRADAYYGRAFNPHYYVGASYTSDRVERSNMTRAEIRQYKAGYDEQRASGEFKENE